MNSEEKKMDFRPPKFEKATFIDGYAVLIHETEKGDDIGYPWFTDSLTGSTGVLNPFNPEEQIRQHRKQFGIKTI